MNDGFEVSLQVTARRITDDGDFAEATIDVTPDTIRNAYNPAAVILEEIWRAKREVHDLITKEADK